MKTRSLLIIFLFVNIYFGFAQNWNTDFSKAKEIATNEKKPIILVFQGSDWCAPCMKLEREIWSTETFKSYSKEHYVLLKADFPRSKKNALPDALKLANARLAETYNTNGIFPFVVVLDHKGKVLGETGYKKITPKLYIDELNAIIK